MPSSVTLPSLGDGLSVVQKVASFMGWSSNADEYEAPSGRQLPDLPKGLSMVTQSDRNIRYIMFR